VEAAPAAAWRAWTRVAEASVGAPTGSYMWVEGDRAVVDLAGAKENQAGRRRGLWAGGASLGAGGRLDQGKGGPGACDNDLIGGA
jgi:hypothetical protein